MEKTEIKVGGRNVMKLARIRNAEDSAAGRTSRCLRPKNDHKSSRRRTNNIDFLQLVRAANAHNAKSCLHFLQLGKWRLMHSSSCAARFCSLYRWELGELVDSRYLAARDGALTC
jgi:hypothetical protein